jgi:hypothetical protein
MARIAHVGLLGGFLLCDWRRVGTTAAPKIAPRQNFDLISIVIRDSLQDFYMCHPPPPLPRQYTHLQWYIHAVTHKYKLLMRSYTQYKVLKYCKHKLSYCKIYLTSIVEPVF